MSYCYATYFYLNISHKGVHSISPYISATSEYYLFTLINSWGTLSEAGLYSAEYRVDNKTEDGSRGFFTCRLNKNIHQINGHSSSFRQVNSTEQLQVRTCTLSHTVVLCAVSFI